jgi:hypothetical protein
MNKKLDKGPLHNFLGLFTTQIIYFNTGVWQRGLCGVASRQGERRGLPEVSPRAGGRV